jgi:hydrogenase-4 component F
VIHTLPWTGSLLLVGALAVTGTPPFSIFQSEFTALSAALAADQGWAAMLFLIGVVTIFSGFLVHMTKMNLGAAPDPKPLAKECPWKLGAMLAVASVVVLLSFWLPSPVYTLVQQAAQVLGATP